MAGHPQYTSTDGAKLHSHHQTERHDLTRPRRGVRSIMNDFRPMPNGAGLRVFFIFYLFNRIFGRQTVYRRVAAVRLV